MGESSLTARKADESFERLGRALDRFGEILERDLSDDGLRDGAIQRFEFCYELFWKSVKAQFQALGRDVGSAPNPVLSAAYLAGWFDDEARFRQMGEDRNLTSHTYKEELAEAVASRLAEHYAAMRKAYDQRDTFR